MARNKKTFYISAFRIALYSGYNMLFRILALFVLLPWYIRAIAQPESWSLDKNFGQGGMATTAAYTKNKFKSVTGLHLAENGSITVTGNFITRYTSYGTPDSSFGNNGFVIPPYTDLNDPNRSLNARSIVWQSDGKFIITGQGGSNWSFLARYQPSGTLDSSFGQNGIWLNRWLEVDHLVSAPDNTFFAIGSGSYARGGASDSLIVGHFLPDGTLDTVYGTRGYSSISLGRYGGKMTGIGLLNDGRLMMVGIAHDSGRTKLISARFLANGQPDPALGGNGTIFGLDAWYCHAATVLPDGGAYLTVSDGTDREELCRLDNSGNIDTSFGEGGFVNSQGLVPTAIVPLPSKALLCAGMAAGAFVIGKIKPNGKGYDSSFGAAGFILSDYVAGEKEYARFLQVQSDGKLLLAGDLQYQNLPPSVVLLRYAPDADSIVQPNRNTVLIELYPNPSDGRISISGIELQKIERVRVYARDGRLVETLLSPIVNPFNLDAVPGIYILELRLRSGQLVSKQVLIGKR